MVSWRTTVWGDRGRISHDQASRRYQQPSSMHAHHSDVACNLSTPPRSCRRLTAWRLTWDQISRTEIKCTPRRMYASHSWGLKIIVSWAKRKQTSRINTPGRRVTSTAESVSAPYSSLMFDVQSVSQFYRCSITDVYIGRSLIMTISTSISDVRVPKPLFLLLISYKHRV